MMMLRVLCCITPIEVGCCKGCTQYKRAATQTPRSILHDGDFITVFFTSFLTASISAMSPGRRWEPNMHHQALCVCVCVCFAKEFIFSSRAEALGPRSTEGCADASESKSLFLDRC